MYRECIGNVKEKYRRNPKVKNLVKIHQRKCLGDVLRVP